MPFDNYTDDDFEAFEEEMNRPRSGVNLGQMRERLRKAGNAADRIIAVIKIIETAKKSNPSGLPF